MNKKNIIIVIIICCVLAVIASFIASSHPDGLEWVAEELGFISKSENAETITSPMPDYETPQIKNKFLSPAIAAIAGVIIVFLIAYLFGILLKKRNPKPETQNTNK